MPCYIYSMAYESDNVRERVVNKLWQYLDANFQNFTDANKIKIISSICAKSMPQIIEGNYNVTKMQNIKLNDKEQELQIGNRVTEHTSNPN